METGFHLFYISYFFNTRFGTNQLYKLIEVISNEIKKYQELSLVYHKTLITLYK